MFSHLSSCFSKLLSTALNTAEDKFDAIIECCKGRVINFNTTGVASAVKIMRIRVRDVNHPVYVNFQAYVDAVFNAATTNVLTLGTSTTATEIFDSTAIDESTVGPNTSKLVKFTASTDIYAKYTQTGTAATTGKVTFLATGRWGYNQ